MGKMLSMMDYSSSFSQIALHEEMIDSGWKKQPFHQPSQPPCLLSGR
jgi:hypothetical protein